MTARDEPPPPEVATPRLLEGQAAVVTGASSGIGRAVAVALGEAGARVLVNWVADEGAAQRVVAEVRASGADAIAHRADVSDEDEVVGMFARAREAFGTVHVLVNNAGIQRDAALLEMSLEDWQGVLDVNLTGQFLCAREAAREFLRRGVDEAVSCAAGKIVCISSVHERIPWAGHVNYAASKGGVELLMKSVAQELAPRRVRVNSIAPGAIETPINEESWKDEEARAHLLQRIPYGRVGTPEDVARVAVWLASDQADYLTGATLTVDGGMTLYPSFRES